MASLPQPAYMPCSECGASLARGEESRHVCNEERRLRYQIIQLRDEIAGFDDRLAAYLDSPQGRFELWYAERSRRSDQS
jgi:hypothetical protein